MRAWWNAVGLVAGREIAERGRSRSFRAVTLLLLLVGIAVIVVPPVIPDRDEDPARVAVAGTGAGTIAERLRTTADAAGVDIEVERRDAAGVRGAVQDGELAAAVVGEPAGRDLVLLEDGVDRAVVAVAVQAAADAELAARIDALGLTPDEAARLAAPTAPAVETLGGETGEDSDQALLGFAGALLLFFALTFTGASVAAGVAEEKSSRISEILLATLSPTQLLTGKIIGIGFLGVAQLLALAVPAAIGAVVNADDLPDGALDVVGGVVLWFVLGFALYSCAYGALGALVSRQDEVGVAIVPLGLLLLVGYLIASTGIDEPDSPLLRVASFLPPFAPTVMPMRMAAGVPTWEVAVSAALTLATTVLLVRVAGVVYRRAIVRTGPRLRLRDVLRPA